MHALFDNSEEDCPWYYFDGSYKTLLGALLIIFGVFGVLLNAWLYATFIHSHLLLFRSHVLLLNLCSASLGRNLLGFPFAAPSAIAKRWLFGSACCRLFAFLNQFFGVFQITALLVVVLERYLLARYYRRERTLHLRLYWTLIGLCWMVAVFFSTPPLFGYGLYACDVTGTVCTLIWPSPSSGAKHFGFSVPYVIVCGILPVIGIFYYMGKAVRLEKIYYRSEQQREEKRLTKCVHMLCVITLACWIPAAVLAGWQWFPLLLYGYRPHVPQVLAIVVPVASEDINILTMSVRECEWIDIFDDISRRNLEVGFIVTGVISTVFGCWLNATLLLSDLRSDQSYRNLAFFTNIACVRRAFSILTHFPLLSDTESNSQGNISCDFFGFVETFFAVYEYECLTHVCIERYVVAKYTTNGWPLNKNHYILYQGSSLFFSALYSLPPVFGLGKFGLDFGCQSCVLDTVLPETWHKYVTLTIFLLRSFKSTGFIVVMLIWARNLEARYESSSKLVEQTKFTDSVIVMTVVNVVCWMPIAVIRGWVLLSYLLSSDVQVRPSASSVQFAVWLQWAAPALTTIAMYLVDERVNRKMLRICETDEKEDMSSKQD